MKDFFAPDAATLQGEYGLVLPTPNIYADLVGGSDAGTGSSSDPATTLEQIVALNPGEGDVIGVKVGSGYHRAAATDTAMDEILKLQNYDDITFVPWGDTSQPIAVMSHHSTFNTQADWQEIDPNAVNATTGGPLKPDGTPEALLAGSKIWKHITCTRFVQWIAFGELESITSDVSEATYKQNGLDSNHTYQHWMETDFSLVASLAHRWVPSKPRQWTSETGAGLIVYSEGNPIDFYGPIYASYQDHVVTKFARSTVHWYWPMAFRYCGRPFHMVNESGTTAITPTLYGLQSEHCGRPFEILSGDQFTDGGAGAGSVWRPYAPYSVVTPGNEPWIEADIRDVRIEWAQRYANVMGWVRNTVIDGVYVNMANLANAWSAISLAECYADYGEHNELRNFEVHRGSGFAGEFGDSDGAAFDLDGNCSSWWIHDGLITECIRGVQFTGARRNQKLYNVDIYDCLQGVDIDDGPDDGETEVDVSNCNIYVSDPSTWNDAGSPASDLDAAFGIRIGRQTGFDARGPSNDPNPRTYSKNRGVRLENVCVVAMASGADSYAIANNTINANPMVGPWDDSDADGVADNGWPVTPGQTQGSSEVVPTLVGVHVHGFQAGRDYVDNDRADASSQHGWSATTGDPLHADPATFDFSIPASSPLAAGGEVLDERVEGAPAYTQPAANAVDRRGVKRWQPGTAHRGTFVAIPAQPTMRHFEVEA